MRANDGMGEWFEMNVGVHQGSVMSPSLFNVFMEDRVLYVSWGNISVLQNHGGAE